MSHFLKRFAVASAFCMLFAVSASAQTMMPYATEKALSFYAGTSLNFVRKSGVSKTYKFDHQNVKPGVAINLSYAWFKDIGDWLYNSFNITFGIQQDRISATFQNNDDGTLETYDVDRTNLDLKVIYRLGFDFADKWQLYAGLGPFLRLPIMNGQSSSLALNTGIDAELSLYYKVTPRLLCSFQACFDMLRLGSVIAPLTGSGNTLADGIYNYSAGNTLSCMLGVGYRF